MLSRVFFCDYLYEAIGTQYYIARIHTVKKVKWREASIYMCNDHVYMHNTLQLTSIFGLKQYSK